MEAHGDFQVKLLSSLDKVFPDQIPVEKPECNKLTALRGETVSFQVAFCGSGFMDRQLYIALESEISDSIRIRTVECVPVRKAVNDRIDDNYLRCKPGMYPDLLRNLPDDNTVLIRSGQWQSLWIDIIADDTVKPGEYPITISFIRDGKTEGKKKTSVEVIGAEIPHQRLMHTEWLHADCLADYYHVDVFSDEHWRIVENYIRLAGKRHINMMMVPLFTSPLDTAVGLERTTTQLVDVALVGNEYKFDFSKVKRWIDLCRKCGIEYFEMSHLFSQWGARYAPKVVADVNGEKRKIFGWHTPATGEYTRFLEAFLPELTSRLKEWGIAEKTYFHISDEPREEDLETYRKAKESLGHMLDGFNTFDALSSYEFYRHGLIDKPVPGNNEIEDFLEHGLTDMWTYYCVGQYIEVSNRFMSMPSARNRIYGVQLYKYNIIGTLHWGYNFYNSQFSKRHIDPYEVTDADGAFPAGDAFLVYPGENGIPEESIRIMVLDEAMSDICALQLLESLTSRKHVLELIDGELAEPISFSKYPKSDMYLIQLRNRVNREIAELERS